MGKDGAGGRGWRAEAGGGLQTWRGECVFAPSVSSGYGHSSSGQAGTGIQRVKSIGAERAPAISLSSSLVYSFDYTANEETPSRASRM